MKNLIAVCLLVWLGGLAYAESEPEWLWAVCAGGTGQDWSFHGPTDSNGNSYVTGYFDGVAEFGAATLVSQGGYDVFVSKLDTNGTWLWVKQAGGTSHEWGNAIATDNAGNVYVAGSFFGTATFGPTTLTSYGDYDIFLAKLDTNGNWLWAVNAGGPGQDSGWFLHSDSSGNSYVTGVFSQTAIWGGTTLTSAGDVDAYIAKLDTNGNWLWAKRAGGSGVDFGGGTVTDAAGNVFTSGDFHGTVDFGATSLTSTGLYFNNYIAKLDSNGNWLWASRGGGTADDESAPKISLDGAGDIHVTGFFAGTADFGATNLTSQGMQDIYVAKLDSAGNWLWAQRAGGPSWDAGWDILADASGNSYISGIFRGSANFGFHAFTALGDGDSFVAKVDNDGNWVWVLRGGGNGVDSAVNISTDGNGNYYISGGFSLTTTYGTYTYTSAGSYDILIAKLSAGVPVDDELAPDLSGVSCLQAAYPNPFRVGAIATIKANVAERETGTLTLYNLRGQIIQSQQLSSGSHEITVNGTGLPAGIYLYQLKTPSVSAIRKLVLLK